MLALLALVVALAPPAYAALARNSVGTPQLKQGAVTSVKVRDGNLRPVDLVRAARLDRVVLREFSAHNGIVASVTAEGTTLGALSTHGGGALTLPGPSLLAVHGGVYVQNTSGSTRTITCRVLVDGEPVAFGAIGYLMSYSGTTLPLNATTQRPAGSHDVAVRCSGGNLHAGNLWVVVTVIPR